MANIMEFIYEYLVLMVNLINIIDSVFMIPKVNLVNIKDFVCMVMLVNLIIIMDSVCMILMIILIYMMDCKMDCMYIVDLKKYEQSLFHGFYITE
jgi:hypothetical protein